MTCPGCRFEAPPDFAFCPRCGQKLAAALAPPPPVPAPTPEADRRQVTVLFADLSGFTALSERLDPEEVREFQNALFATMAEAIQAMDGFVEKFVGDAVMAVFGAPVAHEDDPQRAVAAALDMLTRGAALSRQWERRLGQPVSLHVGVHTGPVVAGSLGGGAGAGGAYAVTGDTVNTTARLLSAAPADTILVSDATYALTKHYFAFEAADPVAAKGKAEPVAVHRLVGELADPSSARGLGALGLAAPLVGRADELAQLEGAFARMREGHAQMVSVVGEAGTGKSRLIAELVARLGAGGHLDGVVQRRAACSSLGEPTYGVFGALFRDAYRVEPGDSLDVAREKLVTGLRAMGARDEEAEAVAPVLSYVLGVEEAKPCDVEPEQLQRQIALAARTLLERRLSQAPLLLLVEDLHWADTASLDLLRGAADQLVDRPLMFLLTHRPEAKPPMVARAEQTILRLGPLSTSDTRAMVDGLFGDVIGDPLGQIGDIVVSRAGGNPLFVEEIVRMLVARGVLVREGDRWASPASCQEVDVPPTLQGLLLSRIDKLGPEERRLLQEAAVLGVDFDEAVLRAVATAPRDALGRLVEADLLQPAGRGREGARFRFAHALVHDVAYQNLLLTRRTEMHERVGRALEQAAGAHPERLSDLEALGHHWSLSADKARGARYLLAAGDWARGVYANDDAIRHYDRARRILADCPGGETDALAARERLGDLLGLTGRRAEALAHYEAVRGAAEAGSDGAATARLHRKIGGLHWDAGDRERAGACFAAGLERLGAAGDAIERAHLFQEMGRLAFRGGDNAAAIEWAEKALAEATGESASAGGGVAATEAERAREAAAVRVHAYNTLGVALARTGRPTEAVEQIERSVALAEARDLLQAACRGYTNLSVLYASLDPPRSIETCRRGLAMARRVGDLGFQSRLYANLAVAYCALTDRCEAEGVEAAQAAVALDRRLGLIDHLAVPLIVLGQIEQCHGDHTRAFACYEEALGLAEQAGEPQLLFPCYDGLATLYLDTGDVATAERYLAKAQAVCERAGVEPDALMVLPFLC